MNKKPTDKMIKFAKDIVEELELEYDEPDYEDYDEVSEFISYYKNDFYNRNN